MKSQRPDRGTNRTAVADIFHNDVTAWIVLAISLAITALAWYVSHAYVSKRASERFSFEVEDARHRITERMVDYEQALRGGAALFHTLGRVVTREEWHRYVSELKIPTYFPGIQGIGFAAMLDNESMPDHLAAAHRDGFPDYGIKPAGRRAAYAPVTYLEPFDWRNQRAHGYDMYSNEMRRNAMDLARDSGLAVVSKRVTLVQETDEDVQAGFLVYLPVYRQGEPLDSVAQHRRALLGFVYSPFRVNDLMQGILGAGSPEVSFDIYDGDKVGSADALLYASDHHANSHQPQQGAIEKISLPGHDWTVQFHSTAAFDHATASSQPELIAIGGIIVDTLLFTIIWQLGRERRRVQSKVESMTAGVSAANQRFALAQDMAGFGIWDYDLRDGRLDWDARMHEIYAVPPVDFSGNVSAWTDRVHPDDLADAQQRLELAIETQGHFNTMFRIVRPDGEVRVIRANGSVQLDANDRPHRLVGINWDVTERHLAEEKLSLAASVFKQAHEGIIVTDAQQRIIDVNPAFTEVTGYSPDEVIGQTPKMLSSDVHDAEFYAEMWRQIDTHGFWRGRITNRRKSGEMFTQMETISAVTNARGEVQRYIAVFSDITQLIEQQQRLERMAHYDALTGLPNRVLFADRMNQAMASTRRSGNMLAVCYLDLDGFKPVNDRLGHAAGDQLLIDVARRLERYVRGGDSVARLGGDEFAILIGNLEDMLACEHALGRLIEALIDTYDVGDGETARIAASIGVTLFPYDDTDADALLRHADHAMYLAKQQGRGRYVIFDALQDLEIQAHRETVTRAAAGLREDEFELYFQPKVNMRSGEVIGAEALIRWNHPQRGLLPPHDFLPAIDSDNLAIDLGRWVIEEALRRQSALVEDGLETCISINISGRHLQHDNFVEHLRDQLNQHPNVRPELIELEVLETTILDDITVVSEILNQCRVMGVSVSLDDFGTGYSSLTYLKQLPADMLKIDRSFVGDMLDDQGDRAIVEGIIGLGRAFRRSVIAEGVETAEHGKLLLHLGCELGQGYGIARPMPAAELADWIRNYSQPAAWRAGDNVKWL